MKKILLLCAALTIIVSYGCGTSVAPGPAKGAQKSLVQSDKISIPESVRDNLGITFATVERRHVSKTLRLPGYFEVQPSAHREYRAPMSGKIELIAKQYDKIEPGTPLFRLNSPEWRSLQRDMVDAQAAIETTASAFTLAKNRAINLQKLIMHWTIRVDQLDELDKAGGGKAADLAEARTKLSELMLEQVLTSEKCTHQHAPGTRCQTVGEKSAHAELEAAKARFDLLVATAAAVLGMEPVDLQKTVESGGKTVPAWLAIREIVIKATNNAVIEEAKVASGAWVEAKDEVFHTMDPRSLRFRATCLQCDLGKLTDGMKALIVPPQGGSIALQDTMQGKLTIGLEADPTCRTIDIVLIPDKLKKWARQGVSAQLEVVLDETARPELAIPNSSIVRDGLVQVYFRQTPGNPNEVKRVIADLGPSDGKWTVLYSGVAQGNKVVLAGVYELKLITSGHVQKAESMCAPGCTHEND